MSVTDILDLIEECKMLQLVEDAALMSSEQCWCQLYIITEWPRVSAIKTDKPVTCYL